jgi:hypothetical protein
VDEGVKQRHAFSYYVLQPLTNHMAQGVVLPVSHFNVRTAHDIDALFEASARAGKTHHASALACKAAGDA